MSESRLPWLARLLLRAVPASRSEDVIGDLEELHARRLRESSRVTASLRTTLNAVLIAAALSRDPAGRRLGGSKRSLPLSTLELKLAVRMMAKQPVLTAVAIVAMAIGIGLATAGYTLYEGITKAELPFEGGDRFFQIAAYNQERERPLEVEQYQLFRDHPLGLAHVGAVLSGALNLQYANGEVESVRGTWITPSSMDFLPYRPLLGRPLMTSDGAPAASQTVVLSESLWRRRFEASRTAIGRTMRVDGIEAEIVGVMPDALTFPERVELWIALPDPALGDESWLPGQADVFGVLAPNTSVDVARDRLQTINRQIPTSGVRLRRIALIPFARAWAAPTFDTLMIVSLGLLVSVLLVIALNVANLILARTSARTGELAVRTALGADRTRLVGQVFVEVLVMTSVAAALGLAGAHFLLDWIQSLTEALRPWVSFRPTVKTVSFVFALTVVTAAVAAVLPALRATRRNTADELKGSGRSVTSGKVFGRAAGSLLVVEMALAVALLIAGATMGRAVMKQLAFDLGAAEERVLTAYVTLPTDQLTKTRPGWRSYEIQDELLAAVRQMPNVLAAGTSSALPRTDPPLQLVAISDDGSAPPIAAAAVIASDGYFESLGATALEGRVFRSEDRVDRPMTQRSSVGPDGNGMGGRTGPRTPHVIVVNKAFALRAFGNGSAVGRRVEFRNPDNTSQGDPDPVEIVGVVPNLGFSTSHPEDWPAVFAAGTVTTAFWLSLLTDTNAMSIEPAIRRAIVDLNPMIRVTSVQPLSRVGWDSRAFMTGAGLSMIALGVVALLLSAAGVYAILAYTVSSTTREIGVRVALGASPISVLGAILRRTGVQLVAGAIAGGVLTVVLDDLKAKLPEPYPSPEPWMLPATLAVLFAAGLIASWIPARRALGITPSEAFRAE
jgi:putative ABC transport system permease protein